MVVAIGSRIPSTIAMPWYMVVCHRDVVAVFDIPGANMNCP
jgi:hypothetical protein